MADIKTKKRRHRRRKLLLIAEILLIILAIYIGFMAYIYSKLQRGEWSDKDIYMNENIGGNIDKYTNIALFGVDSRENSLTTNTRSDAIIIASMNRLTHKLKLVSIYRDTLVYIPDHGYTKLNHAYAYGGPKLAVETINRNFDMNITDFVTVNFSALTDLVDALGGVTVEITEEELDEVNRYAKDVANINKKDWSKIKSAGEQLLTGVQATGYSRVRYTKGGDFTRAERQRTVIKAIIAKAKHTNPVKLLGAADSVLPQVSTSLSGTEFVWLASFFPFYSVNEQDGFPFDKANRKINKASVVVCDTLSSNVSALHEYLFGTKDYAPSDTVISIDKELSSL
ncbi:MAG: LytR family transcriptional regulator [Lachnospiraceae bacterium]|nr:LytR family transcriptional regulator [Lachnospiraceae bacterium]